MKVSTRDLIDELYQARSLESQTILKRLVIRSLPPLHKQTYDIISSEAPEWVSSMEIGERLHKKLNHVGNILKSLHNTGLLVKDIRTGTTGVYAVYRIKEIGQ